MLETVTAECQIREELLVMNPNQSSPILSLSQEEVIINNSRLGITNNFNFFNSNVNIQQTCTYSKLQLQFDVLYSDHFLVRAHVFRLAQVYAQ